MRYCPQCGSPLGTKLDGGRDRQACVEDGCGFIHFGEFSIGCAGVVLNEGRALLVQRGWQPGAGTWQMPGGYAEHDEPLSLAVEREVLEESGIEARVSDVVAFRHAVAGPMMGRSTNIYVVFRLERTGGELQFDGDEILAADFFSLDEMSRMQGVQGLSRWAIEKALAAPAGQGLQPDREQPGLSRPGWELFGLQR
jgi:ADP-ribose pyrophosphatase YjhB (NUDIX family)